MKTDTERARLGFSREVGEASRRMGRAKGRAVQAEAREAEARERDFVPPDWTFRPELLPKRPPGKR